MNFLDLENLIGHSLHHPDFSAPFKAAGLKGTPVPDDFGHGRAENRKIGLQLTFDTKRLYQFYYGDPKSIFTKDPNEMILQEINFDMGEKLRDKAPSVPLLKNIMYGEHRDSALSKFKNKPREKDLSGDSDKYRLVEGDLKYLLVFDKITQELLWMRASGIDVSMRRSIELRKSFRAEDKKINPAALPALKKKLELLPTLKWRKRMKKGDENFTEAGIEAAEQILSEFVELLIVAVNQAKSSKVYAAIKKTVKLLNKLNNKYDSIIETSEREELVKFIMACVKLTGFSVSRNDDLTEEWREW